MNANRVGRFVRAGPAAKTSCNCHSLTKKCVNDDHASSRGKSVLSDAHFLPPPTASTLNAGFFQMRNSLSNKAANASLQSLAIVVDTVLSRFIGYKLY